MDLGLGFDQAAIGMPLVGLDGRFLRVNQALCERRPLRGRHRLLRPGPGLTERNRAARERWRTSEARLRSVIANAPIVDATTTDGIAASRGRRGVGFDPQVASERAAAPAPGPGRWPSGSRPPAAAGDHLQPYQGTQVVLRLPGWAWEPGAGGGRPGRRRCRPARGGTGRRRRSGGPARREPGAGRAAALASTWATDLAPGMATTPGWETQASATWAGVAGGRRPARAGPPAPARPGAGSRPRTGGSLPGPRRGRCQRCTWPSAPPGRAGCRRRPGGRRRPRAAAAPAPACGPAGCSGPGWRPPGRRGRPRPPASGAGVVAHPDLADQPAGLEGPHPGHGRALGDQRVGPVDLVQVEVVGAEPGQAARRRRHPVPGRPGRGDLGGQHHRLPGPGSARARPSSRSGLAGRTARRCRSG